jgi:enoyl-CoA hydratase
MAAGERTRVAEQGHGPMGPTRMLLNKPVIAAIEGAAVAGGLELAIWADMRVASESALFGIYCRRFGVPLVDLGTIRLPRLIGHGRAMDMILTGRAVLADEAYRIGLIDRLVPQGAALQSAVVLAREISSYPQICLRNDRMSAITQWHLTWDDALRQECRLGMNSLASGEAIQGAAKFASGQGRHGESLVMAP